MDWEAVARYLAGESRGEEQAAVRRWLAEHPADARMVAALDNALGRLMPGPEATLGIDVESALASVKARRPTNVLRLHRSAVSWLPIAAAAGIVLVAGLWWMQSASESLPTTMVAARTLSTPVGGRDSLILPDGSQVMLGPGSELRIAEGFGEAERRVSLTGEALFTVVHNDAKPFVVDANGASFRDVGTAFVVHSDAGGARIAVTEGVVELTPVAGPHTPTVLNAGDAASVTPGGNVTAQRGVGAADELAWTRGKLVFRDTPLSEVSEDLQRWYGIRLDIQDAALRRRPLSASFEGDSLRAVIDAISLALGATAERRGDTVILRSLPR